ncbi:hypothetical protein K2P97_08920 [bacterium]|nr:hypothetical protein [bacterium]
MKALLFTLVCVMSVSSHALLGDLVNCPEDKITYIDKSEGGPGAICMDDIQPSRTSMHPDTRVANKCKAAVTEIAKMNMDQHAKASGFEQSDIGETIFDKSEQGDEEKLYIYNVDAFIYKGNYNVEVKVDSSCAINSVKITEIRRDSTAVPE